MADTLLGIIISAIVSSILTLAFCDKIISVFQFIAIKLGWKKNVYLAGKWCAKFEYHGETYVEIIKVLHRFSRVRGKIIQDKRNYDRLRKYMDGKKDVLRVKAQFTDNQYLTGFWYHPIEHSRHYGTFQLIYDSDTETFSGIWVGFSTTARAIESSSWTWERITD